MKRIVQFIYMTLLCLNAPSHFHAVASEYPTRPIEMIISADPGSGTDLIGRMAAELAQEFLGVKITITNKPGGAGAIGCTFVKNSKPDGYCIGMTTSTLVSHKVFGKLPFDHHDVEVVLLFQTSPNLLCVLMDSPYKTLDDLIADAIKRPGQISWATASGNLLITSNVFFRESGAQFKVIPSGGGGVQPAVQVLGGHVDVAYVNILEAKPQIEAGMLRPLVINAETRLSEFPDIPTFQELGYQVPSPIMRGIITPPGVERERLVLLNNAFRNATSTQKFRDFVKNNAGIVLDASFDDAMDLLNKQEAAFRTIANQN